MLIVELSRMDESEFVDRSDSDPDDEGEYDTTHVNEWCTSMNLGSNDEINEVSPNVDEFP